MNFAAERFLRVGDWRHTMHEVMARLGATADVDRVVLFEAQAAPPDDIVINRRYEWVSDARFMRPEAPLQGLSLRHTGYTRWIGELTAGRTIASHVRLLPASEQPVLLAQGIQSVLVVPILVDVQLWGFIGFDACTEERTWSATDKTALSAGARLLGEAIRQERIEQAQRESEARFQAVTESATDAIIVYNADGRIVLWNKCAERLFRFTREEALGTSILDLIDEPYRTIQADHLARLRAGVNGLPAKPSEGVCIRKDGTRFPVEVSLAHWQEDNETLVGAVVRDIHDRKKSEASLLHSRAELREAQRVARVGSWQWDIQSNRVTWSTELYLLNGLDPELPVPSFAELDRFYTPESWTRLSAAVERALQTGEPYQLDLEHVRVDGSHMWTLTRGEAVRAAHGQIAGLRGTVLDITDRKLAENALRESEARLRQAQKMEAVGQLAGGVAHDFNNLLTAICGYADLVMENLDEDNPLRADVAEIKKAGDRAAALTRQLLAFGRKQIAQPRARSWPRPQRHRSDAQACHRRGRRADHDDRAVAGARVRGSKPYRTGAAEPCRQRPRRDAGRRTSRNHGGHRRGHAGRGRSAPWSTRRTICGPDRGGHGVRHDRGRAGAHVRAVLHDERPAEDADRPAEHASPVRGSESILVVEDEASVRALITRTLQRHGFVVIETSTPEEALATARTYPKSIDLLITDLIMPGMNGHELAKAIVARHPRTRVLLISGYPMGTMHSSGEAGVLAPFLQKPFAPSALLDAVRKVLDDKSYDGADVIRPAPLSSDRVH